MADAPSFFRKEALDQLNSPEQLEQLLQVTDRKAWLSLVAVGLLLAGGLGWSVFGQIPVTVDGAGVLLYPRSVVPIQSSANGTMANVNYQVGQQVSPGDIIGEVQQVNLAEKLRAAQAQLAELLSTDEVVSGLTDSRQSLELDSIEARREQLSNRIATTKDSAARQLSSAQNFSKSQIVQTQETLKTQRSLQANLRERYQTFLQLQSEGLSSNEVVLNAKQRLIDNEIRISELELRIQEISMSGVRADETFQKQMEQVADLEAQLQELEISASKINQAALESNSDREIRIQNLQSQIAQLEQDLSSQGNIRAEFDGEIIELSVRRGQVVSIGQILGFLQIQSGDSQIEGLGYFRVGDGKKIRKGMEVRISPSTVERERFGSIVGVVSNVGSFPVTVDGVVGSIGNRDLARELLQNTSKIDVTSSLLLDPSSVSGFKWTSGVGPPDTVTSGTTAVIQVTVESRRPISFAIPILRNWTGV